MSEEIKVRHNKEEEKITIGHHISLKEKPQTFVQTNNAKTDRY